MRQTDREKREREGGRERQRERQREGKGEKGRDVPVYLLRGRDDAPVACPNEQTPVAS